MPSTATTNPRAGRVVDDPGQQLGKAGAVVLDRAGGDRGTGRVGDLYFVGVAVQAAGGAGKEATVLGVGAGALAMARFVNDPLMASTER